VPCPSVSENGKYVMHLILAEMFYTPLLYILAKHLGCSLWKRSMILGSADRKHPRLISCEIIFEVFQLM